MSVRIMVFFSVSVYLFFLSETYAIFDLTHKLFLHLNRIGCVFFKGSVLKELVLAISITKGNAQDGRLKCITTDSVTFN